MVIKAVVENFNLAVSKGESVTIIGSSGSGKTTILKMVNGLILPDQGTVYVNGKDIIKEGLIALRRNIRRPAAEGGDCQSIGSVS